jgi:hypothetical protein
MPFPPKAHEWSDDAWEVWTVEQVNFHLHPSPRVPDHPIVLGTVQHFHRFFCILFYSIQFVG